MSGVANHVCRDLLIMCGSQFAVEMAFKDTLTACVISGGQHLQGGVPFFLIYFAPSERHLREHTLEAPLL